MDECIYVLGSNYLTLDSKYGSSYYNQLRQNGLAFDYFE